MIRSSLVSASPQPDPTWVVDRVKAGALLCEVGVFDISQAMSNNDTNHSPQRPYVGEDSQVLLATYPMASTTPVTHRTSFATLALIISH